MANPLKSLSRSLEKRMNPCPVCGRKPKIRYLGRSVSENGKEDHGYVVRCKPTFKDSHVVNYSYGSSAEEALRYIPQRWNDAVLLYLLGS